MTEAAKDDRVFELLEALRENRLDATSRRELTDLIETDPAGVDRYVRYIAMWSVLEREPIASPRRQTVDPSPVASSTAPVRTGGSLRVPLALAAALLAAAAVVGGYVWVFDTPADPVPPRSRGPIVATLIDVTGNVLVNDDVGNPGNEYTRGDYSIRSGSASFMLRSLVAMELEGRTHVRLNGPMLATLRHGSARFNCPPDAKGFTVRLPDDSTIVDLGTAFSVDVDDGGESTLRVLEGRVEWVRDGRSEVVGAGEIARVVDGDIVRSVVLGPRKKETAVGPLRDGGFDLGFEWEPGDFHQFVGLSEVSDAWVETVKHPRVRLFSEDRLIVAHSPPSYAELMSGDESGGTGMIQVVRTKPGVVYELVAQVARSSGASNPTIAIDLADGAVDGLKPGDIRHERVLIDWRARTWRERRVRFTATSNVTTIRIFEPLDSRTRGVSPLIDSIKLNVLSNESKERTLPAHQGPNPSLPGDTE